MFSNVVKFAKFMHVHVHRRNQIAPYRTSHIDWFRKLLVKPVCPFSRDLLGVFNCPNSIILVWDFCDVTGAPMPKPYVLQKQIP